MSLEAAENRVISRGSLAIAAFSTIVEWYDFTLYLYFATVLSRVFFGPGEASLLITLGGFAVAYLMRPLGAIWFGHIGDRTGRRRMLLLLRGADDRGDAGDRRAADLFADRRRGGLAAVPAALRDGLLGRRRIYRRRRLSARRRANASPRSDRLAGFGGKRDRRVARGRRIGPDRRPDGRGQPAKLGLANSLPVRRRAGRARYGSPVRPWRNCPNSTGRSRREPSHPVRCATASPTIARLSVGRSPSPRWGRSLTMSESPTFPPS